VVLSGFVGSMPLQPLTHACHHDIQIYLFVKSFFVSGNKFKIRSGPSLTRGKRKFGACKSIPIVLIFNMVLRHLRLTNFRQYETLNLGFYDGVTGIVGQNGAGKSTILEAILWCLFGSRASRTSKEGIKRQAAPDAEPCQVELDFSLETRNYTLSRALLGKSQRSEAKLNQEGRLDAVTTREVDDYVIRLIGLNLKGFLSSFFARQKELNALSDARPADRKDHLAKMLGVGRLDSAISLLKDDIKHIRQKIDILSGRALDSDQIKRDIDLRLQHINDLAIERNDLIARQTTLIESISKLNNELQDLRRRREGFTALDKARSSAGTRVDSIENDLTTYTAELKTIDDLAPKLTDLAVKIAGIKELHDKVNDLKDRRAKQAEQKRLTEEREHLVKTIETDTAAMAELRQEIERLQPAADGQDVITKQLKDKEEQREDLARIYRELSSELSVAENDLAKLNSQKADITGLGPKATCELCLRPFGDDYESIERHFDSEISSIRRKIDPIRKKLDDIEKQGLKAKKEIESLRRDLETRQTAGQKLALAETRLATLEKSLSDARQRQLRLNQRLDEIGPVDFKPELLEKLEAELTQKQKDNEAYIRVSEQVARRPKIAESIASLTAEKANLVEQMARIDHDITALEFEPGYFARVQKDLDIAREAESRLRVEIERLDGRKNLIDSEIKNFRTRLEEDEKSRREIAALQEDLKHHEKLNILFSDFRVHLIGRIRPALSRQTSQLFYEMTGGRYQQVELDEEYNLRLFDNGEDFPVTRFSGGEIDLINLCFRLAISLEMAATAGIEHSFIILDEIFGSQDEERQQMIMEGLSRLKNRFRQIIIISHIDDVKEMAEHIVTVERQQSGISVATEITAP